MAEDSTDAAFGFILFILFLALLGFAAGGMGSSSSTAGTTGGTTQSLPPLAGSAVSSCPGSLRLQQDETDSATSPPSLNLKVYVDPMDPGRKCATATRNPTTPPSPPPSAFPSVPPAAGTVKVTLAYTADKTQMVSNTGNQVASVQVNGTDDFCVSAVAQISGTGIRVTIPKVVEPCMMTVPAMQSATPLPAATDKEDREDGY
jgi:hypothetical protein